LTTPPIPPLRTNEPEPAPAPAPPRSPGSGYLECDFCHCKLTKTGEVYNLSEQARDFRDQKEKSEKALAKLEERITDLQSQIAAKDAEIAALKGSPAPKRAGIRIG
jgi:hypothetical protein